MQAITVYFIGPSPTKGERWKATCAAKSREYDQDDSLGPSANAALAARKLVIELGWGGKWYGGVIKSGDYVFVCPDDRSPELYVNEDDPE